MRHQSRVAASVVFAAIIIVNVTNSALAQDPTKVASKQYKVEAENDQMRVLRINYGPHEKTIMHEHPAGVAIFLTDGKGQFTYPDGKTEEISFKAGQAILLPAVKHQPENLTDNPFEVIQIELKAKEEMPEMKEVK